MKVFILFICILVFSLCPLLLFGQITDVPYNSSYSDSVKRVAALGLMDGDEEGLFRPYGTITREQYVKIVIQALGMEQISEAYKGLDLFNDIDASRWSRQYINIAFKMGLIKMEQNGEFRPEDNVTFEEAVIIAMKAMKYKETDVTDKWPNNYLGKARTIGLTADINLRSSEDLPRWAAAVIIDRLWLNLSPDSKQRNPNTVIAKALTDAPGLYDEYIILGDKRTCDKLASNQILTDKGIFYLENNIKNPELGKKYRMIVDGDTVVVVYDSLTLSTSITVKGIQDVEITYKSGSKTKQLTLPDKTIYYYEGSKVGYDGAGKVLKTNSTIVFAFNKYRTGYEYAVIFDPNYSTPEVAINYKYKSYKLGSIRLSEDVPIIRNGKLIARKLIREKDVVYKVEDIWGGNDYILVLGNKTIGKIEAILPHKLSPDSLQINGETYEISKYLDLDKINDNEDAFEEDDEVIALLGHDDKVVDVLKYDHKTGEEMDLVIVGDFETSEQISKNQILTDKGTFRIKRGVTVKLGHKYNLLVYDNEIVQKYSKLNNIEKYSVENVIDTVVFCRKDDEIEDITLPDDLDYYYNGVKQSYTFVSNILEYNSTIIFGYEPDGKDYEYAVVINPIYSEPEIARSYDSDEGEIGKIEIDEDVLILKEGKLIEADEIKENDVVYEIKNKSDDSRYLLIIDNKVEGEITGILPHVLSPKIIEVNNLKYYISKDFDLRKIHYKSGSYEVGDDVTLILGSDGKIIDIDS